MAGLAGALVFLFLMRITSYRSVFRDGRVISPGNDPYYYRHWLDRLVAESDGPTDVGVVIDASGRVTNTRPLTHASNWFVAELVGGDQAAAEFVAAWLPVFMALLLGVVIYKIGVVLTDDPRVGIASVVLFATIPIHGVYSGLGFLEHRPHQYFWLGVTMLVLAWLAMDLGRRRKFGSERGAVLDHLRCGWTWLGIPVLGIALGFSAHAWGGSILMFVPAAAYVGLKAAMDAREGVSPTLANLPVIVGLGVAGGLAAALHYRWGWHDALVALVPLAVVAGALVVMVLGELWRWFEWPTSPFVVLQGLLAGAGLYAFRRIRPEDWARLEGRMDDLLLRERYTEAVSLFTTDLAIIFGPLAQLGVGFYVGMVVLAWACWLVARRYEPGWLLLSVYVLVWLAIATIQVRFAAQLAIPLSVLGGVGLVYLLAWVDLARVPAPFRDDEATLERSHTDPKGVAADGGESSPSVVFPRDLHTAAYLVGIALLVCGMSLIFVPSLAAQTAYSDAQYEATVAIDEHAELADREYPENFVLSEWGDSRMYNYFVNGESRGYGYAMAHYDEFRFGDDPDSWYDQFEDRVGYVVVTDVDADVPAETTQVRLLEELGTGGDGGDALTHYQLLTVDEDRSAAAFAVVPGATVEGTAEANDTVVVSTAVSVSGESFTYEREVDVGADGTYAVTVPYAGVYSVGDETVTVAEDDVLTGATVEFEEYSGT